jgi:hypothetical protein
MEISDTDRAGTDAPLVLEARLSNVTEWAGCLAIGVVVFVVFAALMSVSVLMQSWLRFCVILAVFLLGWLLIWSLERRRRQPKQPHTPNFRSVQLQITRLDDTPAIHQRGFWRGMGGVERQREYAGDIALQLSKLGVRPRTIVHHDDGLQQELVAIPLIADQVEPEFVLSSGPMSGPQLLMMLVITLFAGDLSIKDGQWLVLAVITAGFALHLSRRPRVRQLFPGVRLDQWAHVAAPGVVKDRRSNVWSTDDSVMLVGGKGGKLVEVQLVGPTRVTLLRFTSAHDPDFIALWQRWNHPQPRPELLLGEEAPSAGADSR